MKKHHHHGLFLRAILLLATIFFGAGFFAATNYSNHYRVAEASIPLADGNYEISVPSARDLLPNPMSMNETLRMVGGWGCRMRAGTPHSILHWTSCF